MKIHLTTLGCKLNESEIEAWARQFTRRGHEIIDDARAADVIVLNTCTITHVAARKTRQLARQLARANPRARIVLTGCFVTISPDQARALPNVALVVPNAEKDQLPLQIANCGLQIDDDSNLPSLISNLQSPHLRTRAFVKIQDGCNLSCAYCIIPRARGAERSRPRDEIVAEVRALVEAGYKEIVLTGVQISAYSEPVIASGTKQSPTGELEIAASHKPLLAMTRGLRDLVAAILAETNVPRLRLTSIAPWDIDDALLDVWRDARLCRHLHLSLQSGCDATLRRMCRPYTTAQFARAVERVRAKIPEVGITTDVIVGFPGETDAEFEQSLRFVEQMQFSRVHVFPYSRRKGTPAATLPHQLSDAVRQARAQQMQEVADASQRAFAARFIGRELVVLWETQDSGQRSAIGGQQWSGYSDNYIRVLASSQSNLHNQITSVCGVALTDDGVIATIERQ